jgi:hypothetical protein
MARIFRDSGVLNQFGSPSLNSNTIANRPAAGQTGRLFVSTDTLVLYRDNGSSWQVISATGSTQNLEQTTTNGNTTTKGIFAGATGSLTNGFLLEVLGRTKLTATSGNTVYIGLPNITPNSATFDVFGYSSFRLFTDAAANIGSIMRNDFAINLNANITTGDPSASINQLTLTCNNIATIGNATGGLIFAGAGLNKNTITDDGTANSTITLTQNSGIFALSPLQSISEYTGLGGTNITHYAGLVINGVKATAGSALRIVNNYQLLINSSEQFSGSTTVTNRWGIYQNGANDDNYFAGNTIIGGSNPTDNGNKLQVNGIASITNNILINKTTAVATNSIELSGGSGDTQLVLQNNSTGYNTTSGTFLFVDPNGVAGLFSYQNKDMLFATNGVIRFRIKDSGNVCIGEPATSLRKLTVNGQQEWITTLGTGAHTTSGNHLPIWVNGVQYWLALLNPPILP